MIETIIIDDESNGRSFLKNMLSKFFPNVKILGEASGVDDGAKLVRELKPNLVFLDVEMPAKNGFELFDQFDPMPFEVIFTTAHDSYALYAIKFSALDYLLKPLGLNELKAALEKTEKRLLEKDNSRLRIETFKENTTHNRFEKIAIPTINGFEFISIKDIIRMQGEGNYSHIYMVDQRQVTASRTLKEFENLLLSQNFYRIHKSHLINLNFLKRYLKGDGGMVTMHDGTELEVSRRSKEGFLQAIKQL